MHTCSKKILSVAIILTSAIVYSSKVVAGPCIPSLTSDASNNTCIGRNVLIVNSTGSTNSALGYKALQNNTTGAVNSAFGAFSLQFNTTGNGNVAMGVSALLTNTTGSNNQAFGGGALMYNTTGNSNSALGYAALYANITGDNNSSFGSTTLLRNTTGRENTAVGNSALNANVSGSYNTAVGTYAGYYITGSNNVAIANAGVAGESAAIRIGTQGTHTAAYLAGVYGVNVANASFVTVTPSGQLGIYVSSRRYKENIKPMGSVSEKLLKLRPVTFQYKKPDEDGKKPIQYGLIAEEVDSVMPELVVRNKDGSPETVAYQYIPSLLLNEYQKQHKELVDTKAKMAEMQSQIDKLNTITKKLIATLLAPTKTALAK